MLRLLNEAPDDLGKRGEISKHSPAFDRITEDIADLRVFASNDGSKRYLRVWAEENESNLLDISLGVGPDFAPRPFWFEIIPGGTGKDDPKQSK
jgi:hypothetical protein